ncbi:MAG: TauD/TfdA family dioxygenase [Novosphingobium sp.]|nr:TauD/TfdA family dioxygenase [Novosphingobium sp.]
MDPNLRPIGGPAAWTGAELAADPSWQYRLDAAAIAELDAALGRLGDRDPPAFAAADFALPTLGPLLRRVGGQLETGHGLVRIGGLPVARWTLPVLRRAFWGICLHLGTPLWQNTTGECLAEVKDETGSGAAATGGGAGPVPSARARSRSTGALRFHTDKCDVLALACAANGIAGGVSRIVSSVAIHDAMASEAPDLLATLYQDFWRMRPADEEGELASRLFRMPVFARGPDGDFTSQYSRTYVEMAHAEPGVPVLSARQVAAMDKLAELAGRLCFEAPFEPGQIQLMNQHVTYHGRTAYADDAASGARRNLLRIWLAVPQSRALPQTCAVQWGATAPGALRGGAIPGRSAVAA